MIKGILIIALGDPNYGKMAANLAASIRYSDKDILIHLVWSDKSTSHLTAEHKKLFTSMSECPKEYYHHDKKKEYIKAKTHIYDLTPFDETLFLDADMLMLPQKRISDTIDHLSEVCDYTIENRNHIDLSLPDEQLPEHYCNWVNIREVKSYYKTEGKFYHLHSEFIFFKKNDKNKLFFDKVRQVYDERPLKWQVFDGAVPDEYAFDIATAITGHYPHQDHYIVIYWTGADGLRHWYNDVSKNFIGFSLGGNHIPFWIQSKITACNELYKQSLRLPYAFKVISKAKWNTKRASI